MVAPPLLVFFRGHLRGGRPLHFPSPPDPLFKASKALFLTLRVATPSGAPRQVPLEQGQMEIFHAGSHQFRESLWELIREFCSSREMPSRKRNFAFRHSENQFLNSESCSESTPEHSESVCLKLRWSPGF